MTAAGGEDSAMSNKHLVVGSVEFSRTLRDLTSPIWTGFNVEISFLRAHGFETEANKLEEYRDNSQRLTGELIRRTKTCDFE